MQAGERVGARDKVVRGGVRSVGVPFWVQVGEQGGRVVRGC